MTNLTRSALMRSVCSWATVVFAFGQSSASPVAILTQASSAVHGDRLSGDPARVDRRRDSSLWMEMRNVDLHIDPRAVMHIHSLRGRVLTTSPGSVASLDEPASFKIEASSGVIDLDGDAITALLNEIVFDYPGAPIKKLRVRIEDGMVIQTGTLHKGVDIPFEMWSVPVLQPDGRLRLHPDRMHILGVNGLAMMHALGLHLDKMMDLSKSHGASVSGDDIYLEPLKIIPPPFVEGRLRSVRVEGNVLSQEFERTADDTIFGGFAKPDTAARNFIYFRGNTLRFGKLTMSDTDLLILDADDRDPFDIYFKQYNQQLVAGHTRNQPNYGLRTWMVDYGKLAASTVASNGTPVTRRQ